MTRILIGILILLSTTFGQSYLKLNVGSSLPVGDYSENQFESPGAEPGITLSIEGAWLPSFVGLRAAVGVAGSTGRDDYNTILRDQLGSLPDSYDPGAHAAVWFAIGPSFQIKGEKVTGDFHLGLGYMNYGSPEQELIIFGITSSQPAAYGGAFTGTAGAGVRFHLTPGFALYLGAELVAARPEVTVTATARSNQTGISASESATYEQRIMMVNANLGFCLNL